MQMTEAFPFIEKEHFVHKPVVKSGNVVTAIGMFFREFAACVLGELGYDVGEDFMETTGKPFTEEELTFYWTDEEYREFLEEWRAFGGAEAEKKA